MTYRGLELAELKKNSMIEKLFPDCINKYSDGLYTITGRPAIGKSQNIAKYMVDMIFPETKMYEKGEENG